MKHNDCVAEFSRGDAPPQQPAPDLSDISDEGYNKRAALIFLAAAGATLLLTGATGSLLLRRAQASSIPSHAAAAATSVRLAAHARPRKPSTLKDLFRISASDEGLQGFEFRTNRHLATPTLPAKLPLDFQQAATKNANVDVGSQDASYAVADGVKALAIATTIVVGGAGVTVYALAKRMGVSDPQAFADGLRDNYLKPFAQAVSLYMPFAVPAKLKQPPISIEEKARLAIETREWDEWAMKTDVKALIVKKAGTED